MLLQSAVKRSAGGNAVVDNAILTPSSWNRTADIYGDVIGCPVEPFPICPVKPGFCNAIYGIHSRTIERFRRRKRQHRRPVEKTHGIFQHFPELGIRIDVAITYKFRFHYRHQISLVHVSLFRSKSIHHDSGYEASLHSCKKKPSRRKGKKKLERRNPRHRARIFRLPPSNQAVDVKKLTI